MAVTTIEDLLRARERRFEITVDCVAAQGFCVAGVLDASVTQRRGFESVAREEKRGSEKGVAIAAIGAGRGRVGEEKR